MFLGCSAESFLEIGNRSGPYSFGNTMRTANIGKTGVIRSYAIAAVSHCFEIDISESLHQGWHDKHVSSLVLLL
jgi:hypothetical protein